MPSTQHVLTNVPDPIGISRNAGDFLSSAMNETKNVLMISCEREMWGVKMAITLPPFLSNDSFGTLTNAAIVNNGSSAFILLLPNNDGDVVNLDPPGICDAAVILDAEGREPHYLRVLRPLEELQQLRGVSAMC